MVDRKLRELFDFGDTHSFWSYNCIY